MIDKKKGGSIGNFSNSMTIVDGLNVFLWRPNNYRRRLGIRHLNNSTMEKVKSAILNTMGELCTYSGRTKLLWVSVVNGGGSFRVQVGRDCLVGVWSQNVVGGHKEVYKIDLVGMERRKEEIRVKIDEVLVDFAKKWGLFDDKGVFEWVRHEDWIKGEEYIDKLPAEVVIHDTVFKKVYSEGVEFIGGKGVEPASRVKNYIKNRALEDLAPGLVRELNVLVSRVRCAEVLSDPVGFLFDNGLVDWFNAQSRDVQDGFLFGGVVSDLAVFGKVYKD